MEGDKDTALGSWMWLHRGVAGQVGEESVGSKNVLSPGRERERHGNVKCTSVTSEIL